MEHGERDDVNAGHTGGAPVSRRARAASRAPSPAAVLPAWTALAIAAALAGARGERAGAASAEELQKAEKAAQAGETQRPQSVQKAPGAESVQKAQSAQKAPGAQSAQKPPDAQKAPGLAEVTEPFARVMAGVKQAAQETDGAKSQKLFAAAWEDFGKKVEEPLNAYIADLNRKVAAAQAAAQAEKKEVPSELLQARDYGELTRVKIYQVYGSAHPERHAAAGAKRKEILDKALALADAFVDERFNFMPMQFDGQLQRGVIAFEQGLHKLAVEHLSILFDPLEIDASNPTIVAFFKSLRLQALLYGARAMNAIGSYERAGRSIEEHFLAETKGPLDLSRAESEKDLQALAIQVRLELAVALAGIGKAAKGLDIVHGLIEKYSPASEGNGGGNEGYVTDARRVLGRIAAVPGVELRGRDYFQAGLGLKSEYRMDEALVMFRRALAGLGPREAAATAPSCLNEIGEVNFLLGKAAQDRGDPEAAVFYTDSALAYRDVCRYFAGSSLVSKAATNFLAAATRAVNTTPGGTEHAGLRELEAAAKQASQTHGENVQVAEALMQEAQRLEQGGDFAGARKKYLEVPAKVKSLVVPFYWRAQASAWAVALRQWERAAAEEKAGLAAELEKAKTELAEILPKALAAGDQSGAAVAALTLGQLHYNAQEFREAADVLSVFLTDLGDLESYRCRGWGDLALARIRLEECEEAETIFRERLYKGCRDESILADVAWELAEGFRVAGDANRCALYMLLYTKHPSAAEDLEKLERLRDIIKRLIEGGGDPKHGARNLEAAEELTRKAEQLARTQGQDFGAELSFYQAKILVAKKDWGKAIPALQEDVKKHKRRGDGGDDAYVWRLLADAYLKRSGLASPPVKDTQRAERCLSSACGIMDAWRQRDPALDREFWTWIVDFLRAKKLLCDAGDQGKCGEIRVFVEGRRAEEMGGADLKAEILALYQAAGGGGAPGGGAAGGGGEGKRGD
jgi:tetratricopeptide (TPR) repeat protein